MLSSVARAQSVCTQTDPSTLRTEPKRSATVSWIVGRYMPLLVIGQKGSWYQVRDLDGEKHWIFGTAITNKFRCLAIKSAIAPLRTGPGKEFPLADIPIVDRYTGFKRIDSEGEWDQVEDPTGLKGWIEDAHTWKPVVVKSLTYE